jgi:hypothetical protein
MDGKRVYPGVHVKRPGFYSVSLKCTVSESWGIVKRLYRQEGSKSQYSECDVIVETEDQRFFWLDQVVRTTKGARLKREAKADLVRASYQ